MKWNKKLYKNLDLVYLHHDGHAVFMYREYVARAKTYLEYADVYEDIGIKCTFNNQGRLIIKPEVVPFLEKAERIRVSRGVEHGSDNTRKLGLLLEIITLYAKGMNHGWGIDNFPGLVCSEIYWNEVTVEFAEYGGKTYMADTRIRNIIKKGD